ncbi:MAG: VacB/RNase II family 3'-5' exoribonuclease [Bacilli bacterium]|nr:VacB/RNase II family 3'-5' exoribonuclease [Bacilli bacterium]
MKDYIDYALKKEKKPVEIEKVYKIVEEKMKKDHPNYVLSDTTKEEIDDIIATGVENYEYFKTPKGRYTLISKTSFRKGSFHGNRIGGGTVYSTTTCIRKDWTREVRDERFTIDSDNCANAVDGDIVLIDTGGNGKKTSIVKVLERNITEISGEVTKIGNRTYVKPFDKRKNALTILLNEELEEGSAVTVSLNEMSGADLEKLKDSIENPYMGEIKTVVPNEGPFHRALIEAFKVGIPQGFSDESLKQAAAMPQSVSSNDKYGREDITRLNVISIDGESTKDKDDAISLDIAPNGNLRLGVHIADVPYYVKEGTPIDLDAFRKGNSYYYCELVNHQLPPELSNGICSLNEKVERLTKTMFIELDENYNIVNRYMQRTVIKSRKSLTYEKVNALLNGEEIEDYMPYKAMLELLCDITQKFQKDRVLGGAIIFNRPEIRFKHDDMGNPIKIVARYSDGKAETIISESMLLANTSFGQIMTENKIPLVYRVHGLPKLDGISRFLRLLKILGIPYCHTEEEILKDKTLLQELLIHVNASAKNKELRDMLNGNLIKCMSHASYSPVNIGHYGTGFEVYTHFTSPIRRLADLANSRIADECYFEENEDIREANKKKWASKVGEISNQSSAMERLAEELEKSVLYMDTASYLSKYVGEEFEGTIVSLSEKSIGVQLENLLEGNIRPRYYGGDYVYNDETYTLVSLSDNINYYLGDKLKLKLVDTSATAKTVDFRVIEKIKENTIRDKHKSNQYVKSRARDIRKKRPYN